VGVLKFEVKKGNEAANRYAGLRDLQTSLQKSTQTRVEYGKLQADRSAARPAPRVVKNHGSRGIVVEGERTEGAGINKVETKFDPQPAMSLFIRYWTTPLNPQ
jgi:hypothetical protein